jgi:hypothetical protein
MVSERIHWGRALLGGFFAEVVIFAIVLPVSYLLGEQALLIAVPPACLVATFLFGLWAGRGVGSRFVLHGFLVGAVAALLYIGLTIGQPLPLVYTISHGLKVLGGTAGGFAAERRTKRALVADVERAV